MIPGGRLSFSMGIIVLSFIRFIGFIGFRGPWGDKDKLHTKSLIQPNKEGERKE
jgi:hypothetical protein